MAKQSQIDSFREAVRDELCVQFTGWIPDTDYTFRTIRPTSWGQQFISVAPTGARWPYLSMIYYFGVRFQAIVDIEQHAGIVRDWGPSEFSMSSLNVFHMKGLWYPGRLVSKIPFIWPLAWDGSTWHCHGKRDSPHAIVQSMRGFYRRVLTPFFDRFTTLESVRESLLAKDNWLLDGTSAKPLLMLDIALGQTDHFRQYVRENRGSKNFRIRADDLNKLMTAYPEFAV